MIDRLLLFLRRHGLTQRLVAVECGRSEAWLSKRLRGHEDVKAEERTLLLVALSRLLLRPVSAAEAFGCRKAAGRRRSPPARTCPSCRNETFLAITK